MNLDNIQGGLHSVVRNLIEGFEYFKDQVYIISLSKALKKPKIARIRNNTIIIYFPFKFTSIAKLDTLVFGRMILSALFSKIHPDIIHVQESSAMLSAISGKYRPKALYTEHGVLKEEMKTASSLIRKLSLFLDYLIGTLFRLDNIIFISKYNQLLNKHIYIKTALIPNPVTSIFLNTPTFKKTQNRLLYVGAIHERKNILLLLESMSQLIKINIFYNLKIIGDFTSIKYKNKVVEFIKYERLEPFINFLGWQSAVNIVNTYSISDILVLPSNQETLPLTIIEAQSSGLVVIATKVGGISELIENNYNGFLINKKDSIELTSILKMLYDNSAMIEKISKNASNSTKNKFSSQNIAGLTRVFYKEILGSK